ncbi:MAG: NUDIX hydrolase [Planctomycetota bacterium]
MQPATHPPLADLAGLLRAHAPASAHEERSQARILALLAASGEGAFDRARFAPGHLTASAIVTDPERARAVLIFHTKLGRWLQPGGHFEASERDPWLAARREVREETGLEPCAPGALLDLDVHQIPARPGREPAHEHFDLRYHLLVEASAAPRAGDGTQAARWFTRAELADAALDLDESLRRALAKALG